MPSTSKSNRRKPKAKFVPKPKQEWRVKEQKRNWLEVPFDVMANILYRVGVHDILENAQKVCTTWRKICKDPAMWRVIHMENKFSDPNARPGLREMCKHAVDRSQGQLVDITIVNFADNELIEYVADRSRRLKRLEIACCYAGVHGNWTEAMKKLPLLEELSIYQTPISEESIITAGHYCPMLRTLKINQEADRYWYGYHPSGILTILNEVPIAIGENLHELRHLEIIGMNISNVELQVILDGCCHLETLDLRRCLYVNLEGEFGKKCLEKVKCLKHPNDSLEGCPYIYKDGVASEFSTELRDSDYDDSDYDDYNDTIVHYALGAYEDVDDVTVHHDFEVNDDDDDTTVHYALGAYEDVDDVTVHHDFEVNDDDDDDDDTTVHYALGAYEDVDDVTVHHDFEVNDDDDDDTTVHYALGAYEDVDDVTVHHDFEVNDDDDDDTTVHYALGAYEDVDDTTVPYALGAYEDVDDVTVHHDFGFDDDDDLHNIEDFELLLI